LSSNVKKIGEPLLKSTPYGVRVEGVDVVMSIGAKECRMDCVTALRLAAFLRHSGRIAKSRARMGNLWTAFADLTDANLDELNAQSNRDRTAVFYNAKLTGKK
jgi:hypothetical protein